MQFQINQSGEFLPSKQAVNDILHESNERMEAVWYPAQEGSPAWAQRFYRVRNIKDRTMSDTVVFEG